MREGSFSIMKTLLLVALIVTSLGIVGCQQQSVLPDTSEVKRTLPPGQKPKDVLLPINK